MVLGDLAWTGLPGWLGVSVRWVVVPVVHGQLSAPQGHHANRDSRGLGPSRPAGPSSALKKLSLQPSSRLGKAQVEGPGPGPGLWHRAQPFLRLSLPD